MTLCEQCGSISIVRAEPEPIDKLLGLFTSNRPFVCRRCGWRGRRDWSDADLRALLDYGAGGAEPDPDLAVLDDEPKQSGPRSGRRGRTRTSRSRADQFDLATLDLSHPDVNQSESAASLERSTARRSTGKGRGVRSRRNKTRRQKVTEAIAATVLVMLVVTVLGMAGCFVEAL